MGKTLQNGPVPHVVYYTFEPPIMPLLLAPFGTAISFFLKPRHHQGRYTNTDKSDELDQQ